MRQSTKRKKLPPVPFHQLILDRAAAVLAVRNPRRKRIRDRAVDVAALVRRGKVPKEHREAIGECINVLAVHIGGIKGNKHLSYADRAEFYGAADSLKAQNAEDAAKAAAPVVNMLPPQFAQQQAEPPPQAHERPPVEAARTVTAAE